MRGVRDRDSSLPTRQLIMSFTFQLSNFNMPDFGLTGFPLTFHTINLKDTKTPNFYILGCKLGVALQFADVSVYCGERV